MIETARQDVNSAKAFVLRIAAAYIACYVKGEWQNAMELALLAHKNYLSGRNSYDITLVWHKLDLATPGKLIWRRSRSKSITKRFGSPLVVTLEKQWSTASPPQG